MMSLIYPIVEGHGEKTAIPELIRKILYERLEIFDCCVCQPFRLARSKIVKFDADLERAVRLGGLKIGETSGGVIIISDADDDCPLEMQGKFNEFYGRYRFNFPVSFVMANREYEAWMISCGQSMRTHRFVRNDAPSHENPEEIRDAKGFFRREILVEGRSYSETIDQAKFTNLIDVPLVFDRCRSFRKFVKEIERLSTL